MKHTQSKGFNYKMVTQRTYVLDKMLEERILENKELLK